MSVYYVGNVLVSDELYHHGIKGQRCGIRRYQNPDGTLTDAGKERYGRYGNSNSVIRRFLTGDHVLGNQRHRDKIENRLENKIQKNKSEGKDTSILEKKYAAQKAKNADIHKYVSNTSTGKLFAQNLLMTGWAADTYRAARSRGASRGRAYLEAWLPRLNLNPLNNESVLQKYADKKKYGALAHDGYRR